jgi:hypothetical protein
MGVQAMKRNQDLELENLLPEDAAWAGFLSDAAELREVDENAAPKVLNALKLERSEAMNQTLLERSEAMNQTLLERSEAMNQTLLEREQNATWANYLSSGAVLRPVDYASVKPALNAVKLERTRARKVLQLNIMKFVTASAAVAAVMIGVLVFRPASTDADPTEAFTAYQEASQGW